MGKVRTRIYGENLVWVSHWPRRANFSFCLQNEAKVYKINTRWLGLKSDPGSRVTLFDGRLIFLASLLTDPLFSLQSPSGARH